MISIETLGIWGILLIVPVYALIIAIARFMSMLGRVDGIIGLNDRDGAVSKDKGGK